VHLENTMLQCPLTPDHRLALPHQHARAQGLDTQGEYRPVYTDLQSYWTYDLTDKVELGFLGLYSSNTYGVVPPEPRDRVRQLQPGPALHRLLRRAGTHAFETWFGALNVNVPRPTARPSVEVHGSAFNTYEQERFDMLGEYFLDELERDLSSEPFGEVVRRPGCGPILDHARNDLEATVITFAHKGYLQRPKSYVQWGADVRSEVISDKLSEWTLIDSADYSIPLEHRRGPVAQLHVEEQAGHVSSMRAISLRPEHLALGPSRQRPLVDT
jgi:hypothetical protein